MTTAKDQLLDTFVSQRGFTGQLLIAMPSMADPRFQHAVIYVCSHGPSGAMGLVINKLFGEASFPSLLEQLNIKPAVGIAPDIPIHYGGPVEMGRGFILHSDDCMREGTTRLDNGLCLSATVEILQALADGEGPKQAIMTLGYTGWGAGQLDEEVRANGWLTTPADKKLIFSHELTDVWARALSTIGISPATLSVDVGHA